MSLWLPEDAGKLTLPKDFVPAGEVEPKLIFPDGLITDPKELQKHETRLERMGRPSAESACEIPAY